ncbi:hypothetical protein [Lentilitoribacter sp. EG35]|uniref:hypothetical protein n=1 Tax=Lentilitoribacter sp. EG35 TaxID=3234192 RepID=UPI00345F67EC
MKKFLVVLFVFSLSVIAPAMAQEKDETVLDLISASEFLKKQRQVVSELQAAIEEDVKSAEEAEAVFDKMIESYQEFINTVGSESENAAEFDRFIALYQGFADDEVAKGNDEDAAALLKIAEDAAAIKINFINEAAKSVTIIEQLKQEKSKAVTRFRIRQGQKVIEGYKSQYQALVATNNEMDKILKDAQSGGGITIKTEAVQE